MTTVNFSVDLSGRTAIVTGASSGLGLRFAQVLAACGAKVACTARRKDKLDALVAQIRADGGEAEAFALDVRDASQLQAIIPTVAEALGKTVETKKPLNAKSATPMLSIRVVARWEGCSRSSQPPTPASVERVPTVPSAAVAGVTARLSVAISVMVELSLRDCDRIAIPFTLQPQPKLR